MRIKNLEITYQPRVNGFVRFYGKGSIITYISGWGARSDIQWYNWILFLTKIRVIKFGNPQHKINSTDYNISVYDAIKKLLNEK